ncbi:hypothetical protein OQX63_04075 [Pedobacter sp. PF22-3]|uniref:hypothetical protein n=1 Tax=Pedobacter sp. PF22-3 TaxID=2994467 RepID=UPI002247A5FC|nr:hypothetical protein [Pedobacter sp. PF22-3]MCX2492635.1 hypothetical protein [Pedobacter sp. PF22-3]
MTHLENYATLINSIFGPGTATFSTDLTEGNNVIGALNNPNDFNEFKQNFTARLKRIHQIYSADAGLLEPILVQVNEIASEKNWQGAFAELSAFDHLNKEILTGKNYLFSPIQADVTLPKESSFAKELGKQETNLDGYIESVGIYFDIKVLKDNVNEILEGIYKDLEEEFPTLVNIMAEYDMGISYSILQQKRNKLLKELSDAVVAKPDIYSFRSKEIPELSFVFSWKRGVSSALRTYGPYRHAGNHHTNIFIYANKFLKDQPTLIILVSFPWYNQILNQNRELEIFQRSYARRVFCQYKNDITPFANYNPKFSGTETIYGVSNYLSGIIFLNDKTILSNDPDSTNVDCSVYLNPNAKNNLSRSIATNYLHEICNEVYDDFADDNY